MISLILVSGKIVDSYIPRLDDQDVTKSYVN